MEVVLAFFSGNYLQESESRQSEVTIMLPIYYRNKTSNAYRFLWLAVIWMLAFPVYAQLPNVTSVSAETMLTNIAQSIPNLMQMVTAIAYVMGMVFIARGVVRLKHVGEMRTQMSHEHSLTGPLAQIAVGALLLYLPTSVQVGMSSFWTNPNPYGYLQQQDQWTQFINDCFLVVQFIGTIAFIRGLIILSHLGESSGQQKLSNGLTHIIGGIFCINIYQFIQVILLTLGIQIS
jgi:uncharacterized membrane protein HdeD (DUF308 family)